MSSDLVPLPESLQPFLDPYLPSLLPHKSFITLTYAQSIDAKIAITGQRTLISHIETKTMTHYLRSKHDGILIGYKTAMIDDPKLNNRFDESAIVPIVIDPDFQWDYEMSKLRQLVEDKKGKAPIIVVRGGVEESKKEKVDSLIRNGGAIVVIDADGGQFDWGEIFMRLKEIGLKSIMVEGGAEIIKQLLLENELVDSLIVTIGSTYLGSDGVDISPKRTIKLKDIDWWKGTTDSVLAARLQ